MSKLWRRFTAWLSGIFSRKPAPPTPTAPTADDGTADTTPEPIPQEAEPVHPQPTPDAEPDEDAPTPPKHDPATAYYHRPSGTVWGVVGHEGRQRAQWGHFLGAPQQGEMDKHIKRPTWSWDKRDGAAPPQAPTVLVDATDTTLAVRLTCVRIKD